MVTYNHGHYIRRAIESVLEQKTDFNYELVIGEDCSTDGTREIVAEFQSRYPERIRATLYPTNMGAYYNGTQTLLACRKAEYVAFLDGDDYWTSVDKLQKQVDYLDRHPECSLCFHKASVDRDGQVSEHPRKRITGADGQFSFDDIILENFIDASTVLFQSVLLRDYPPKWLGKMPIGDWPLWILCAQAGKLGYIAENMATYRIHSGGAWSKKTTTRQAKNILYAAKFFRKQFHIRNRKFDEQLAKWRRHLIDLRLHQGDYFKAANDAWGLLPYAIAHSRPLSMFVLKTLLRGYLPFVWNALNRMKQVYGRVAAPSK
jgi:glycosyltransferase involved in cell wall biosynthesis